MDQRKHENEHWGTEYAVEDLEGYQQMHGDDTASKDYIRFFFERKANRHPALPSAKALLTV